jgi:hypothetical protein
VGPARRHQGELMSADDHLDWLIISSVAGAIACETVSQEHAAPCNIPHQPTPLAGTCLYTLWYLLDSALTMLLLWRQVRLAAAVGQQRRMSPDAARLFTEGAPCEVVLPDCTRLEPAALAAALQDCATPRCGSAPAGSAAPRPLWAVMPHMMYCVLITQVVHECCRLFRPRIGMNIANRFILLQCQAGASGAALLRAPLW